MKSIEQQMKVSSNSQLYKTLAPQILPGFFLRQNSSLGNEDNGQINSLEYETSSG